MESPGDIDLTAKEIWEKQFAPDLRADRHMNHP